MLENAVIQLNLFKSIFFFYSFVKRSAYTTQRQREKESGWDLLPEKNLPLQLMN